MKDLTANRIKGYACLLVLFGHVLIGLRTAGMDVPSFMVTAERFIWTFHIDLFMFASGYVYMLTGSWKAKGSRARFLGHKAVNLGVPYLFFSVVYIVINSLTPAANNASSLRDILFLWYQPVAQYWFLFALLWIFVFYVLLSRFLNNVWITAVLYAVLLAARITGLPLGCFDYPLNCVLAFGIGTCVKSLNTDRLPVWSRIAVVAAHIAALVSLRFYDWYDQFVCNDLAAVLGIAASVVFIACIEKCKPAARALDFVCKYSMPIYLLHTIFTAAVRILLLKLGIENYALHVAVGTVVGFVCPCVIYRIASCSPYLTFPFAPMASIKKIRSSKKTA